MAPGGKNVAGDVAGGVAGGRRAFRANSSRASNDFRSIGSNEITVKRCSSGTRAHALASPIIKVYAHACHAVTGFSGNDGATCARRSAIVVGSRWHTSRPSSRGTANCRGFRVSAIAITAGNCQFCGTPSSAYPFRPLNTPDTFSPPPLDGAEAPRHTSTWGRGFDRIEQFRTKYERSRNSD